MTNERKYLKLSLYKTDLDGDPIFITDLAQTDIDQIFKISSIEKVSHYFTNFFEICHKVGFAHAYQINPNHRLKYTSILNIKGIPVTKFLTGKYRELLVANLDISENQYPETSKRLFIINAPLSFKIVFKMISLFLSKKTLD